MIDYKEFKDQVNDAISNNRGVLFKSFLSKEDTPTWSELLTCIYHESKEEDSKDANHKETAYGNVLLSDKLYVSSHLNENKRNKYFPNLVNIVNNLQKETGISLMLIGPKICFGPHKVDFHVDSWHAFALQCEGGAKWTLSDSDNEDVATYTEEFCPEPGDLLFFPQGLWHKIETTDTFRAGIQFNADIPN